MRYNHRAWFRNDYIEPESTLTEANKQLIAECVTEKAPNMKTIYNVTFRKRYLGQVRTTFAGQFYRFPGGSYEDWTRSAYTWPSSDPRHGTAIHALLKRLPDYEQLAIAY
ncbi:MAG: hypothetical protein V2J55_10945 [Candidatus Competibacteraceae bacterium]|jgi:hypothetical protein|nr:hypothetical protein [Candidatus Competibacteraceae bacterium]